MKERLLISACLLGFRCKYDGSFSHARIPGAGVAAEALRAAGLFLLGDSEAEKLLG